MAYLRLRQICLVASDLAQTERQITDVLGLEICFRDPGVGKYGLHNALFAMGGTFLEIVSPIQPDTAAGRYIERRRGDGGYMYIVDCDDLERRREHFIRHGVRLVEDLVSREGALTGEPGAQRGTSCDDRRRQTSDGPIRGDSERVDKNDLQQCGRRTGDQPDRGCACQERAKVACEEQAEIPLQDVLDPWSCEHFLDARPRCVHVVVAK